MFFYTLKFFPLKFVSKNKKKLSDKKDKCFFECFKSSKPRLKILKKKYFF
jgi:hypothetical protein